MRMVNGITNAEYLRKLREEAAARGKCNECRKRDVEPDRRTCRVCLDRHEDRRRNRLAAGLCKCGRQLKSRYFCTECLENRNGYQRSRRADAKHLGLCTLCFNASSQSPHTMCRPCLDKHNERILSQYHRRRRAA